MAAYITAVGNLGRDPETRAVGSSSVTKLTIACNHKDKNGDVTTWLNADIWGRGGEVAQEHLRKGDPVQVNGEFVARPYTDKANNERISNDVKNASFSFVGKKPEAGQSPAPAQSTGGGVGADPFGDSDIPF